MTTPRVVVTGASGRLGPYLAVAAAALGTVVTMGRSSGSLRADLTTDDAVEAIADLNPAIVLHAAALTDVDQCEREPAAAAALNVDAPVRLAEGLPADVVLVLISTDQVYPDTAGPHREDDVGPVNVYGRTKLEGERGVLARPGGLVVRTNFFGPSRSPGRKSLSDFIIGGLRSGQHLTLFDDILFSPLHLATTATVIVEMAQVGLSGVFNLGSRAGSSKAEFGLAVAAQLGLDTATASIGPSTDVPGRAPRARDLRMDVTRLEAALGRRLPTLEEEVSHLP